MPTFQTIFAVDGNTQTIQTMSGGSIRAKSKHYFNAVFRFGADDPFLELDYLSATFSPVPFERCRNGAYIVPLTAQDSEREAAYVAYECEIPWEVLTRKGKVYVGVFAGDMLVTNEAQIEITAAAPVLGADSQPTQSWWGRFAAAIAQLTAALIGKQDKLTAGENITIDSNNVISASGGAVIQPYTDNPAMDGTASAGSSDAYARGDHVHPTDTSRASQTDLAALSQRIDDILPVVRMIYGVSTRGNAVSIRAAGCMPILELDGLVYQLAGISDDAAWFWTAEDDLSFLHLASVDASGHWETYQRQIDDFYSIPSGGIPQNDLASDVQTSLGKADTALQTAPVSSVNGQTGAVVLTIPSTAADVGAEPAVTEVTVASSGAVTQALDAGKLYHFTGALASLTLTLNAANGVPAQYHFDFAEGSTAFDPVLPASVVLPDGWTWAADTRYEVDILNNYAVIVGWAVSA